MVRLDVRAQRLRLPPFQIMLNPCYLILADVRPLRELRTGSIWVRPFAAMKRWAKAIFGKHQRPSRSLPRSMPIAVLGQRAGSSPHTNG
jgi:hypothetical protein